MLGDKDCCKQPMMQASWADTPTADATTRVAKMRRGLTSITSVLMGRKMRNDGDLVFMFVHIDMMGKCHGGSSRC